MQLVGSLMGPWARWAQCGLLGERTGSIFTILEDVGSQIPFDKNRSHFNM